jgi:hypothetical protein
MATKSTLRVDFEDAWRRVNALGPGREGMVARDALAGLQALDRCGVLLEVEIQDGAAEAAPVTSPASADPEAPAGDSPKPKRKPRKES